MRHLIAALSAISLALPVWAGDKLIPITPKQRAALRIASAPLAAHAGAVSVGLPATVTVPPDQERIVAAPVAGLLTRIAAAPGESVRAGQPLAVLHGADLAAGQREAVQAAVQARLAEESAKRDEALFQEGIIPESRLQASRAQLAQARAMVAERKAWMRLMGLSSADIEAVLAGRRLVDSITLSAPIAGQVLDRTAVAGMRVEPATPLFRLARLDPLWLEIQAPPDVAAQVKRGQKVSIPGGQAVGTVVTVGSGVGAAQTVLVRARVSNPDGRLRLGQNVSARIEEVAGEKQWRVPARALVRHQGQYYVFVEQPGGFEPQPVKVLSQTAQAAAVDGAFSGQEKIAVEGVASLKAAWQGGE